MLQGTFIALRELANSATLVVMVDDAHLLDDCSATLLHQLVVTETGYVVLTVRTGDPFPEPIGAIIKDERIELPSLSDAETAETAAATQSLLEGPVAQTTVAEIVRLSGGNPRDIQRLIRDGKERNALQLVDGVWQRTGPLVGEARATEIVAETLGGLSGDEMTAVQLLAMVSTLPFSDLEKVIDLPVLEHLESMGVV